jgi:hypothetical protein
METDLDARAIGRWRGDPVRQLQQVRVTSAAPDTDRPACDRERVRACIEVEPDDAKRCAEFDIATEGHLLAQHTDVPAGPQRQRRRTAEARA